ncbi:Lrp/AsnC family transcriptional regulator [Longispora fulva]|uniref:Lrp/AsnC family leucine-responsive transcriptional regulator n=1 Tax=Longispora fulva TaxID=619741 RepID=A0A8J7G7L6_9ACTN|nr:Lrp/AsnC family transcriptional regulator [Longispora fulva]MBG6135183.1 Lrp/AsnC family leucine-responsive transcriptional regulator [Longispora fulva]
MRLDDVDRAILECLSANARISNSDLARAVGLSPTPCLRRVRRMEAEGLIRGYTAIIDPQLVGRAFVALVGVRLSQHVRPDIRRFEAGVMALPEVTECHHTTGEFDYFLKVEVADLPAYESFHADRLAALPGIRTAVTFVIMNSLR